VWCGQWLITGYTFSMRKPAAVSLVILLTCAAAATRAQAPGAEPAYVARGHQVEVQQRALKERLDRFHARAAQQLKLDAPNLLPSLELPPPIAFGYQILPRVIADSPPGPATKPHVVSFSWPWSESLISREMTRLGRLEAEFAMASQTRAENRNGTYEAILVDYRKAVASRRVIDADINYNWLWQRQIFNSRGLFDRLTERLNAEVDREDQSESGGGGDAAAGNDLTPPEFARVEAPAGRVRVVTVPVFTDITDSAEVEAFREAIEKYWHVLDGADEYRVRLNITAIAPERLYCGVGDAGKAAGYGCAAPAKGEHINLAAHVGRFPAGAAVLTTGAESLQVVGARAIVLGPHDVAPRTLAHEFGHILGFPDAYLRGYKDLGVDGFQVLELVPNFEDIMASPGAGSVLVRHFKALIAAREIQELMQSGLDALYTRGDAGAAVARFREVLARNPEHYGATLQLAKALDRAGKPQEALVVWRKMLVMAEAIADAETLQTVRARLGAGR
jgi:hypothetical protein